MISVNIATLKAKLSFYLSQVKRGQEVLVLDRKSPVARMIPSGGGREDLVLTEAARSAASVKTLRFARLSRRTDSTRVLREDRDRR